MTELSTLFLLLGLTFYLYNRNSIAGSNGIWRPVVSGLVVGLCMVLAILSKENGILLALMILIIEATLFSGQPRSIQLRIFIYILAVVPLLLLATYLASRLDTILIGYLSREYTMLERLFTQSRILFTYLGQILFPHNGAFTLFYDHFPLSRSITEPMSTFFACAGIALLLILAVIYRRKFAVFSFAVLWFFGGHVLESSFIDLELYFEHRNYLPSIAVIILLFYLMIRVSQYIETRLLRLLVFALPVLAIIIVTIIEIQIWKQPLLQAGELARRHPQSVRALNHLGHTYLKYGNVGKGIEVYNYYASVHKNDIYPYLRLLHIKSCILAQDIGEERWSELFHQARTSRKSALRILAELDAIVTDLHRNICENMNVENLAYLNLLLMQNDDYFNHRALLHEFMASISLKLHNLKVAVINMEESIRIQPTAPRYVYLIEVLVAAKQYERARQLVEQLHDFLIAKPKEFIAYRQKYQQLVDSIPPLNGT